MALRTLSPQVILLDELGGMDRALRAGAGTFQRGGIYRDTSRCQLGRSCPPPAGAVSAKVRCAPCGSASERAALPGAAERGACFVKTLRVVCALFWLGCGWCAWGCGLPEYAAASGGAGKDAFALQRVRQEISYRHTDLTLLFRRLNRRGLSRRKLPGPLSAARSDAPGTRLFHRVLLEPWPDGGRAGVSAAGILSRAVHC